MKPEAQRIAIAEACGYVWYCVYDCWNTTRNCPEWKTVLRYKPEEGIGCETWKGTVSETHFATKEEIAVAIATGNFNTTAPDYLNDLNEMLKVIERHLVNTQRDEYVQRLIDIVQRPARMATITWLLITAKPSQQAEAFLHTIGKWRYE